MLKLRPHHLLCLQKYVGKGYDRTFTLKMNAVAQTLKSNPNTQIELVVGMDDLCCSCPNNMGDRCSSQDKVCNMDEKAIKACDLGYGSVYAWRDVAERAKSTVLQTDKFYAICGDCEWLELCKKVDKGILDE